MRLVCALAVVLLFMGCAKKPPVAVAPDSGGVENIEDKNLNLVVVVTEDYLEIWGRGGSLPKLFHKNMQALHRENEEDPGTVLMSVYSPSDSVYLDSNNQFIFSLDDVKPGATVATLAKNSSRKLACGQTGPGIEDICINGKPAIALKPLSVYDELARFLILIRERFKDSPDLDSITIVVIGDMKDSDITPIMQKAKAAGFANAKITEGVIVDEQKFKPTTRFYDAVDKWVAFETEDSEYMAGFIYIDIEAGFTFRFETYFTITDNGLEKQANDLDNNAIILRLGRNAGSYAVLSDKEIEQLGLPKTPDWLKYYKPNENNILYLVGTGYWFNHVGASHKAIEPLLKAYSKEPHFNRLEFELAFAYNATKNFDKAIEVLNKAIKNDPENYLLYKELGYAFIFMNQNKLEDAEKAYLKGIELTTEKDIKAEMANNMAYGYFLAKNKPKFEEWVKLTRKYAEEGSRIYYNMDRLEEMWNEK